MADHEAMSSRPRGERRPYRADRRANAAAETRTAILDAARRLFVEHGCATVTVADIAREAETAIPTWLPVRTSTAVQKVRTLDSTRISRSRAPGGHLAIAYPMSF
ncbi:helix-turn-helix domain-containing protein [Amycolatopsis silviterrae]|uniref:Helix-turn-helix domain-containing protein n=1 Tax=Amycolatopsis silviterrae TaxID=1656914 RepID=A0ABW5H6H4_9PSEU